MAELTDESVMTFGKYKGVQMVMVPDGWFMWYWKENKHHLAKKGRYPNSVPILEYIKDSFDEKELSCN